MPQRSVHTISHQSTRDPLVDTLVCSIGSCLLVICFVLTVWHIRGRVTASIKTSFSEHASVLEIPEKAGQDGDVPKRHKRRAVKVKRKANDTSEALMKDFESTAEKKRREVEVELAGFQVKGKR